MASLSDVWQEEGFDRYFTDALRDASSFGGEPYGIPITTYQWGFYYNRSLFNKHNLKEPVNWSEFLALLAELKGNGVTPIALASGSGWPIIGWYQYLNLRLNGAEAQVRLNDIQQELNREEASKVLTHFKALLDAGYFEEHHKLITWRSSLPALFRGQVAMTLHGNFIESSLPAHIADNIGYFPFPDITSIIPGYEIAPVDVLLITKNSQHQQESRKFLTYAAQPAVQEKLNLKLKQISPNKQSSTTDTSPLAKEGVPVLENSAGLSQYFDREVDKALSDAYIQIWIDFVDNPNIPDTIIKMQKVREKLRAQINKSH